jgi:hypothetical protein
MSRVAFSIHCSGLYLVFVGLLSFVAGPSLLPAWGLPAADLWWRCFAALAVTLGAYHLVAARHEVTPLFRAMAWGRLALALLIVVEVAVHGAPVLLWMAVPDVLGASWTLSALRVARPRLPSVETSSAPSSRSRTAREAWRLREPPT